MNVIGGASGSGGGDGSCADNRNGDHRRRAGGVPGEGGRPGSRRRRRSRVRTRDNIRSPNPAYDQAFALRLPSGRFTPTAPGGMHSVKVMIKVMGAHMLGRDAFLGEACLPLEVHTHPAAPSPASGTAAGAAGGGGTFCGGGDGDGDKLDRNGPAHQRGRDGGPEPRDGHPVVLRALDEGTRVVLMLTDEELKRAPEDCEREAEAEGGHEFWASPPRFLPPGGRVELALTLRRA